MRACPRACVRARVQRIVLKVGRREFCPHLTTGSLAGPWPATVRLRWPLIRHYPCSWLEAEALVSGGRIWRVRLALGHATQPPSASVSLPVEGRARLCPLVRVPRSPAPGAWEPAPQRCGSPPCCSQACFRCVNWTSRCARVLEGRGLDTCEKLLPRWPRVCCTLVPPWSCSAGDRTVVRAKIEWTR